jgi:hypothetical protein
MLLESQFRLFHFALPFFFDAFFTGDRFDALCVAFAGVISIGRALRMLPQELRQFDRGQAYRFRVVVAIGYPVMELAPYDFNMSRRRVTNITTRI